MKIYKITYRNKNDIISNFRSLSVRPMKTLMISFFFFLLLSSFSGNCQTDFKVFYSNYTEEKLHSEKSPIPIEDRKNRDSISWYEYDSTFHISCTFEAFDNDSVVELGTSDNRPRNYFLIGRVKFELDGEHFALNAFKPIKNLGVDKIWVLVPFFDQTSGIDTYGGGRFLEYTWVDFENRFLGDEPVIDFNFAFNPYCAYNHNYSCATPPRENFLEIKVEAGEKNFK